MWLIVRLIERYTQIMVGNVIEIFFLFVLLGDKVVFLLQELYVSTSFTLINMSIFLSFIDLITDGKIWAYALLIFGLRFFLFPRFDCS